MRQQSKAFKCKPTPEFLARSKRLDDALNHRKPDRIPVAPCAVMFYPTKEKGISNKVAMYDHKTAYAAWKEVALKYGWDAAPPAGTLLSALPLDIMGISQLKWPGGALADHQPFQWVEGEYMEQDEYDEAFADPNGFAVRKLWSRISTTLATVSNMIRMPSPLLLFMSNGLMLPGLFGQIFGAPEFDDLLKKAVKLRNVCAETNEAAAAYAAEMRDLGYPLLWNAITLTAFDAVSDFFRGMKGSMLDMYRVPGKLLAMIDMFTPLTIESAIMMARISGNKNVFIPLHRGAAGFMSDRQFARFYWPSFNALIQGLIDADLTPVPAFEGDYTPRLDYLADLPRGKILGHFDVVDRVKAKEKIGNVMCFWGNVPASLLCTGRPEQIKGNVRELIDIFGHDGGLIVDSGSGIPDEAKPENVWAMTEAVWEYGVGK
jgi:hypothetical protein